MAREADEVVVLDPSFWRPHFKKRVPVADPTGPPDQATLSAAASTFATDWVTGATPDELRDLLKKEPQMPRELYVQLVLAAEKTTGSLKEYGTEKGELRTAFWRALKTELGKGISPDEESSGLR